MNNGHVMLDLKSIEISQVEQEILRHPQVGGIILFSRNYESKQQLTHLTKSIQKIVPDCIIAVDQEGGRVQRFRTEFQTYPALQTFGQLYEKNKEQALLLAENTAYQLASELREVGVTISFTPVLDMDRGQSQVIGDRAFHHQAEAVIQLGRAFIKGMHAAGMPATGKHFPGHGFVEADSHHTLPVDQRTYHEIEKNDLEPFKALSADLDAIMPAHILYEKVDRFPTCYSEFWLQTVLRSKLDFSGVIFSDDLSMAGAEFMVNYVDRAEQALQAGCDMVLCCNQPDQAVRILEHLESYQNLPSQMRLANFKKSKYNS